MGKAVMDRSISAKEPSGASLETTKPAAAAAAAVDLPPLPLATVRADQRCSSEEPRRVEPAFDAPFMPLSNLLKLTMLPRHGTPVCQTQPWSSFDAARTVFVMVSHR